ncbi:MAG: DUF4839 domain-containing protein [Coriobacteriia bacterium]|nr:DUF4839 domain-containing protein [Coriobacteriia bacterium]
MCTGKNASNAPSLADAPAATAATKNLTVTIECSKNLILSRYDVLVYMDGERVEKVDHGDTKEFSLSLAPGCHEITFTEDGDSKVDGAKSFTLQEEDSVLCAKIHCTASQVEVIDFSVKTLTQAAEDQKKAEEEAAAAAAAKEQAAKEQAEKLAAEQEAAQQKAAEEQAAAEAAAAAREEATKVLTVENSPDLAALLEDESADTCTAFASKYAGRTIEFDGSVDYVANHGSSTTRFDFLLSAGDYSEVSQRGPTFRFNDVNRLNLHLPDNCEGLYTGDNVHIVATVDKYDTDKGFFLKPVSVSPR